MFVETPAHRASLELRQERPVPGRWRGRRNLPLLTELEVLRTLGL
jgi:hypothetical protein